MGKQKKATSITVVHCTWIHPDHFLDLLVDCWGCYVEDFVDGWKKSKINQAKLAPLRISLHKGYFTTRGLCIGNRLWKRIETAQLRIQAISSIWMLYIWRLCLSNRSGWCVESATKSFKSLPFRSYTSIYVQTTDDRTIQRSGPTSTRHTTQSIENEYGDNNKMSGCADNQSAKTQTARRVRAGPVTGDFHTFASTYTPRHDENCRDYV